MRGDAVDQKENKGTERIEEDLNNNVIPQGNS